MDFVPQLDNGDSSEWIWRSRSGRLINKNRPIPPRKYREEYFPVGSIVVVNDVNKHYSGEIQIVKIPIKNDGKRNLIARLAPNEEQMLELINNEDLVEFIEYYEY
ncbi:phospho-sugar glycosidase domain-containing protein [Coprobacillus cateniformis]|uniref:phospho-sugar glycosidase domain-containing protein n=1 Tax=Coprobacillus cateniformis TaxID=100884 RepID=UPI001F55FEBB|nr:phospho-sugar glycosidase domain-containing protein [Coprobacillus cateniformis]